MNPKVVSKKGARGRYRWHARDLDDNNKLLGMSPRDWPTKEEAETAGNQLIYCSPGFAPAPLSWWQVDDLKAVWIMATIAFAALAYAAWCAVNGSP